MLPVLAAWTATPRRPPGAYRLWHNRPACRSGSRLHLGLRLRVLILLVLVAVGGCDRTRGGAPAASAVSPRRPAAATATSADASRPRAHPTSSRGSSGSQSEGSASAYDDPAPPSGAAAAPTRAAVAAAAVVSANGTPGGRSPSKEVRQSVESDRAADSSRGGDGDAADGDGRGGAGAGAGAGGGGSARGGAAARRAVFGGGDGGRGATFPLPPVSPVTFGGFPFGYGGLAVTTPGQLDDLIIRAVFNRLFNFPFYGYVSESLPNQLTRPIELLRPPQRARLDRTVVAPVGYDALDRLSELFVTGPAAVPGALIPAGCIGPVYSFGVLGGNCTVSPTDGTVTCAQPSVQLTASPLTCNLPYRSGCVVSGVSYRKVVPLGPRVGGYLGPSPAVYQAGVGVNLTRVWLGFNLNARRILQEFGVIRWYAYLVQFLSFELDRIAVNLVLPTAPPGWTAALNANGWGNHGGIGAGMRSADGGQAKGSSSNAAAATSAAATGTDPTAHGGGGGGGGGGQRATGTEPATSPRDGYGTGTGSSGGAVQSQSHGSFVPGDLRATAAIDPSASVTRGAAAMAAPGVAATLEASGAATTATAPAAGLAAAPGAAPDEATGSGRVATAATAAADDDTNGAPVEVWNVRKPRRRPTGPAAAEAPPAGQNLAADVGGSSVGGGSIGGGGDRSDSAASGTGGSETMALPDVLTLAAQLADWRRNASLHRLLASHMLGRAAPGSAGGGAAAAAPRQQRPAANAAGGGTTDGSGGTTDGGGGADQYAQGTLGGTFNMRGDSPEALLGQPERDSQGRRVARGSARADSAMSGLEADLWRQLDAASAMSRAGRVTDAAAAATMTATAGSAAAVGGPWVGVGTAGRVTDAAGRDLGLPDRTAAARAATGAEGAVPSGGDLPGAASPSESRSRGTQAGGGGGRGGSGGSESGVGNAGEMGLPPLASAFLSALGFDPRSPRIAAPAGLSRPSQRPEAAGRWVGVSPEGQVAEAGNRASATRGGGGGRGAAGWMELLRAAAERALAGDGRADPRDGLAGAGAGAAAGAGAPQPLVWPQHWGQPAGWQPGSEADAMSDWTGLGSGSGQGQGLGQGQGQGLGQGEGLGDGGKAAGPGPSQADSDLEDWLQSDYY